MKNIPETINIRELCRTPEAGEKPTFLLNKEPLILDQWSNDKNIVLSEGDIIESIK